jgi:hypothetical protein
MVTAVRQQFERDAASGWMPLCMDPDEWAEWRRTNPIGLTATSAVARPCADCLLGFAADMRALGRCNGTPGGAAVDEEEEEPMDQTSTPPRRMALEVTAPPCGSCSHEPVCSLRSAFEGMASVEVGALSVPTGLRLSLVATVSCDHYLRDRTKPAPVRVLTSQERGQANGAAKYRASTADWTPERRAAQGDRMRAREAAKKAEREAASA